MGSVNKAILIGNLGKDPEVRTTQDGSKIVNLTLDDYFEKAPVISPDGQSVAYSIRLGNTAGRAISTGRASPSSTITCTARSTRSSSPSAKQTRFLAALRAAA